jgi:mono/diheme cytochrome c family protein
MATISNCRAAAFAAVLLFPITLLSTFAAPSGGENTLAEQNCTACHDAAPEAMLRLAPRQAPRLLNSAAAVTPQWLRAFLAEPATVKLGGQHPDMMHGLSADARAAAADALTHFIISRQQPATNTPPGFSMAQAATGRDLFLHAGCAACHAPLDKPPGAEQAAFDELQRTSKPLGDLARKFALPDLARFLKDPLRSRVSGRMPSLKLTDAEAQSIAMYLLRDQVPAGEAARLAGVAYDYFDKAAGKLADLDKLTPAASGIAENFTTRVAPTQSGFALRFRGVIHVPKDGEYTFYTESDDGSALFINGRKIVDNDGIHPASEKSGKITLKAGAHRIAVSYFDGGGDVVLRVRWKGPDLPKQEIPAAVLSHDGQPLRPLGDAPFAVDAAKAERGRQLYADLNCAACHGDGPVKRGKKLDQLASNAGCLADTPPAGAPRFALSAPQRAELAVVLANATALNTPLAPADQVAKAMVQFNCQACHTRDGHGGPAGLRKEFFVSTMEADLGDEGVIPPHLNGVGAKLQPAWLKTVLTEGGVVRPYMAARMPQFGARNVLPLAEAFEKADARADALPDLNNFATGASDMAKHGRLLVGTTGLSCISCHTFAGNKSLGVPALDLATVGQRLRWDWFRRYLLDPPSLRPGTRMPPFWPEGKAANQTILKGDTEQQVAAIWWYLARKNYTDLPAGLVQAKLALVASNEAVIYRNFIKGAGSRAIAVAYPEGANLAFDANDICLALIWQGDFIDASRHRTGRGAGSEAPLGHGVIKLPSGAPFAVLDEPEAAWPARAGRGADWQFKGYTLDDRQRPAFRYLFGDVAVEDFPAAVPGTVDAGFRRAITLRAKQPPANLWFRAATGRLAASPDGAFIVDDTLRLKFPGATPVIRGKGDKQELLVPVTFKDGQAQLIEEFSW